MELFRENSSVIKDMITCLAIGRSPSGSAEISKFVHGHSLENSNVDLNREMTMLIVQQRAYEASAKSISTSDQMLQRAINMKNG